MILNETSTLSNGVLIPRLGFGTWMIPSDDAARAVREAIGIGYRHIDTAQAYGNETGVGEGVRTSGIARDQIFVTTKLVAESKSHADAAARIDASLQALGLDHIDLMLIHSPQPWADFREDDRYFEGNLEAWRALEDAYRAGKLRAIGVSNFERVDIENLSRNGSFAPMVDQVLAHVGDTPFDLVDYAQSQGILVQAYSPVAHGAVLNDAGLNEMAGRYGVSVPQLCIRYCLQLGLSPLPKTSNPAHMRENAAVDFMITDADMNTLRRTRDPDYGEASMFPVFGKKRVAETTTAEN
ncbi:aldo/keto reductase [Sphingobium sp. H39-3-25]|uniref:aldo/keto reductase n=1 Tax=Sphingobium arseniciresistens TaxID=3030834 RepID=UPI0023B922F1|nr:aldo/keto reductase [Sphingobium arseniciresistens]